jgi:phosphoribosylamine--glycine ligase
MNVLVIGNGAREHAITWKLRQSSKVENLFVAPGNAGTAELAYNIAVSVTDLEGLVEAATKHQVDLTVIGPETPLSEGLADLFQQKKLPVFGPTQGASRIETSKVFAKQLMKEYGIPTAKAQIFSDYDAAKAYLENMPLPVVVKANGLASGKGVTVCYNRQEALGAAYDCLEARAFGSAGEQILVEECLTGSEVSVFAFTDGVHISPLVAACDYKRAQDGDLGPNTGGMGSYSPPPFWTDRLAEQVMTLIMRPAIQALSDYGTPFQGILYAGLMLTEHGPKVIEFNCRLGDPEAQVILPRLVGDLIDPLLAVTTGTLNDCVIDWTPEAYVGVVAASGGYPGKFHTGYPIHGLGNLTPNTLVFHAATQIGPEGGTVITDGGRILTIVAGDNTLEHARQRVYTELHRINFQDIYYRTDIAVALGREDQK